MEGAAPAATPASTTVATAASTRGGRGRGGRGEGRGGRGGRGGLSRGGRGRGGHGESRGRGGERGRGGRGESRGGRGHGHRGNGRGGFVPNRGMRHRSLSGKHGTRPGQDGEPAAKREKKDQKPNSNFALMHSMLGDAAMIAEYIRDYHSSERFRDPKTLNTFLQAISQRPEKVYEELTANHKDEVFTMLERLLAVYSLGKHTMFPPAHEFLIRCEQAGVRKAAWGEGVKALPAKAPEAEADNNPQKEGGEGGEAADATPSSSPSIVIVAPTLPAEATSLLSPREMLKKLAALDPVGRLQRFIELSSTVDDVEVVARKLAALVSGPDSSSAGDKFDFAAKCQVISKLLSKARRVVEPAFAPPPKAPEAEATGNAEEKEEEEERKRQEADTAAPKDNNDGEDAVEEEQEEAPKSAEDAEASPESGAAAPPPPPRQRRGPLSAEEIETFQSALSTALHALEEVLKHREPNAAQQPLSKFTKLLEWCKAHGLLATADERFIALLEQEAERDIAEQATQLETVISLKSLTAGDTAGLTAVSDQLWAAGDSKCFAPSSVDVLSAMAVAASAAGIDAEAKRIVADRLVQTQRHLADTVVLPRRALRFVNDERNKVKQAAIAKQLEDEEANYKAEMARRKVEDLSDEEDDMALEKA